MQKVKVSDLNALQLSDGVTARVINSENMTIMHANLKAGHSVPEHNHIQEQVVNVIAGEIELIVEGKSHRLTPGEVLILSSNVPHAARAITDCYVIDVFYPIREDLQTGFTGYSEK